MVVERGREARRENGSGRPSRGPVDALPEWTSENSSRGPKKPVKREIDDMRGWWLHEGLVAATNARRALRPAFNRPAGPIAHTATRSAWPNAPRSSEP